MGDCGFLQIGRIGRAKQDVHRQLRQRADFPAGAWTAVGVDPAGAEKVARAIAARIVLPNHHVLPDDSLRLLLLDEDGMGFFEAMFIIEKDLGVKVPPRAVPLEGTFRDLVNLVGRQPAAA